MNLKLIFQLSMFGMIMAIATISLIPEKFEFVFWAVIFLFCAYVIAKVCTQKYFLNGFVLSVFNSVWLTIAHVWFYVSYAAHHPNTAKMTESFGTHPRLYTLLLGIPSAVIFGVIQGLLAFIASKIVKSNS